MQALNFSMRGVLGTRNKSKTHDCERNLSPMILKGNEMVYSWENLDKTRVKLFPNFTSTPFDYLLISWATNYARNRGFLTCFLYRELHALKSLVPAFWLTSKFTWFWFFWHKPFEILFAVYKMFQSWVNCQIFNIWFTIIRHEWTENGARVKCT